MKNIFLTAFFLCLFGLTVFSQVPGRRSKAPFTAVDGYTYSIGDTIDIGKPSNWPSWSDNGRFVYVFTPANAITGQVKLDYDKKLSQYRVIIERFSISAKDGTVYAVFTHVTTYPHEKHNGALKSIIVFNKALEAGEIESKNPAFVPRALNTEQ